MAFVVTYGNRALSRPVDCEETAYAWAADWLLEFAKRPRVNKFRPRFEQGDVRRHVVYPRVIRVVRV